MTLSSQHLSIFESALVIIEYNFRIKPVIVVPLKTKKQGDYIYEQNDILEPKNRKVCKLDMYLTKRMTLKRVTFIRGLKK